MTRLVPLSVLVLGAACTAVRTVHRPSNARELDDLNVELKGRTVEVSLAERTSPLELSWRGRGEHPQEVVTRGANMSVLASPVFTAADLDLVHGLRFLPGDGRGIGLAQGLGLGLLLGALGGAAIGAGAGSADSKQGLNFGPGATAGICAVLVGVPAALLGGIVGAVYGRHEEIRFEP